MLARRTLVMMLALSMVLFVFGCGGGKSADDGIEPVDAAPPPVEEPIEEPLETEDLSGQDMVDPILNDVFYAFDKHSLTAESKSILEVNADELNRADDAYIIIEGHCDERGTIDYNLALGEKRASSVRDYLSSLGVERDRVRIITFGEERPVDTGHTEAAWSKNRRAEFLVER